MFNIVLVPCTKVKSNGLKTLIISLESIKYIEESISRTLHDIKAKDIFKNETSLANQVGKMGLHEIKKLCTSKEMMTRIQRQPKLWEELFTHNHMTRG